MLAWIGSIDFISIILEKIYIMIWLILLVIYFVIGHAVSEEYVAESGYYTSLFIWPYILGIYAIGWIVTQLEKDDK